MGHLQIPCTISISDNPETTSTTRPVDQILASIISNGVIGITSRCSMVLIPLVDQR